MSRESFLLNYLATVFALTCWFTLVSWLCRRGRIQEPFIPLTAGTYVILIVQLIRYVW